jgi:hypothetical protein
MCTVTRWLTTGNHHAHARAPTHAQLLVPQQLLGMHGAHWHARPLACTPTGMHAHWHARPLTHASPPRTDPGGYSLDDCKEKSTDRDGTQLGTPCLWCAPGDTHAHTHSRSVHACAPPCNPQATCRDSHARARTCATNPIICHHTRTIGRAVTALRTHTPLLPQFATRPRHERRTRVEDRAEHAHREDVGARGKWNRTCSPRVHGCTP